MQPGARPPQRVRLRHNRRMSNVASNQRVRISIATRTAQLYSGDTLVAERVFDNGDADSELFNDIMAKAQDHFAVMRLAFPEYLGK